MNKVEVERVNRNDKTWDMTDAPKFRSERVDAVNVELAENTRQGGEQNLNRSETNAERVGERSLEREQEIKRANERLQKAYNERKSTTPLTRERSVTPVHKQPSIKVKQALEILKKTAVVTGNTLITAASAVTVAFFPPSVVALFPVAVLAADTARYAVQGVNGSMFIVDRKHQIKQRLNPFPVLFRHRGQNSSEIFKEETEKLFNGLKPDETYKTKSHAMTYALLRGAEKQGMIYDLAAKKTGKPRNFFFEFLVTGNWDAIKKRKKYSYYDISFKVKNRQER